MSKLTMNFEAAGPTQHPSDNNNRNLNVTQNPNPNPRFQKTECSPLLRNNSRFEQNGLGKNQYRGNKQMNKQFPNKNKNIHNRLGNRNRFMNNSNNSLSNNLKNDNEDGHFNRKRASDGGNPAPMTSKRRWNNNKRTSFPHNDSFKHNLAQNRLNHIRSNQNLTDIDDTQITFRNNFANTDTDAPDNFNDSQEIDATDITVQVVNNMVKQEEGTVPTRFKMILDPKSQAAIRAIQQKRRDKQVIFPFPVTPNVTEISLHERFTLL